MLTCLVSQMNSVSSAAILRTEFVYLGTAKDPRLERGANVAVVLQGARRPPSSRESDWTRIFCTPSAKVHGEAALE